MGSMSTRTANKDLRLRLTPIQYEVTQHAATERPFTGAYWQLHDDGTFHCVVCDAPLFDSTTKYDSGTGWPSFFDVIDQGRVVTRSDTSAGMHRTEVLCGTCGAHLGHRFEDGPNPTGMRYCINSAALDFEGCEPAGGE
jgi:peptide-methionine (R)-S-oxide reductase